MSKGSWRRTEDNESFQNGYDRIFGKGAFDNKLEMHKKSREEYLQYTIDQLETFAAGASEDVSDLMDDAIDFLEQLKGLLK